MPVVMVIFMIGTLRSVAGGAHKTARRGTNHFDHAFLSRPASPIQGLARSILGISGGRVFLGNCMMLFRNLLGQWCFLQPDCAFLQPDGAFLQPNGV